MRERRRRKVKNETRTRGTLIEVWGEACEEACEAPLFHTEIKMVIGAFEGGGKGELQR